MAQPTLRLDTSKKYSTVHGDRSPDDPNYHVCFYQDGLPFDSDGAVVPDDGKTAPWVINVMDGNTLVQVKHHPLYNDEMRKKLARKMARFTKGPADEPEPTTEVDDEESKEAASDDVNIISWLKGEAKYEPFLIYAAVKKRYSLNLHRIRDVVEALVLDQKLVAEESVDKRLMKMLNSAG